MNILIFLILGLLTTLLFPPFFFTPLGFIIFPLICFYIEKNNNYLNKVYLFKYSFIYAFSFFISFLFWIQNPFFVFEETKNYFFLSVILIVILSLIFSILFTVIINYNKILPTIIIIPIAFIIIEYVISIFIYGFPWINFSLIISNNNIVLIIVKFFGSFITSYLIIQIFCLPYLLLNKINHRYTLVYSLVIFLIPIILIIYNNINSKINHKNEDIFISVDIFQLNLKPNNNKNTLKNYNKIKDNIKKSTSEILIFAENNYPFVIKKLELKEIQKMLKDNQTVVIGGTRIESNNIYNSLININSSEITFFDKKTLVPFGEFLPFRKYLSFLNPISGLSDYSVGESDRIIYFKNQYTYIPVICYEIIFYWKLINQINIKSNFIINITNDYWFGNYTGPYQHFYHAKLRAVEYNKQLIRVSNNGISGIINQNGKVVISTELNKNQTKKYNLNLENTKNYYKIHKSLNFFLFIIFIILLLLNLKITNENK